MISDFDKLRFMGRIDAYHEVIEELLNRTDKYKLNPINIIVVKELTDIADVFMDKSKCYQKILKSQEKLKSDKKCKHN